MSKILQENKVLYIEPNAIDDTTKYTTAVGSVTKAPSLEDYCIVVDLEVEIKGRTYNSSKNGNSKNLTMEWQSRNSGQTVRFMEGSKIYTDSSKSSYVNSLTTNYTDIFLKDVEKQGTAEMFGINSIDISYNNFMVPEVTIQFTDVRGVSLFAQEEMRHNLVRNGMEGVANNDIEGSFFKCFFTFPYPRFTLKVKGYYGKMASYELTCSDFRAAFDSLTGNFNVTAKFVGYAFSFLNDVMVNALVAAPYSTYIGKEYWDSQVNSRFKVTDKNGSEVPMVKLGDICKAFKQIEEQVDTQLSQPGAYEDAAKDFNLDANQQNALANSSPKLAALKEHYQMLMKNLHSYSVKQPELGDIRIPDQPWSDSYSFCVVTNDDDHDYWNAKIDAIDTLNNEIKTCAQFCAPLKKWSQQYDLKIIKRDSWDGDDSNKALSKDGLVRTDIVKEERLRTAIEQKAQERHEKNLAFYWFLWKSDYDSTCYVYQDFGLRKILENDNVNTDDANVVQQAQDEIRNTMMQNAFSDYFNFAPTLENITKIIMAHFETYVYMISTCSDNIISKGTGRSTGNLGVNEANFPDAKGNNSTNSEIVVAPFPKVTKRVTQEGVEKDEDTWIGEYGTSEKFEEIALVEGILNGIEEAAQAINYGSRDANSLINNTVSSVSYPLSIIDIFMTENDNPFGDVDIKHPTDIFSRFAVRAFSLLGTVNESFESVSKTIGKIDSENFLVKYGKSTDINILKTTLQDTKINADYIFNYVTKQLTSPEGEWAKPAWPTFEKLVAMTNTKEKCYLKLGLYYGNGNKLANAIAVRNWNWASYSSDFSGKTYKVSTNNLSPYILPNSVKGVDENPTLLCVIKHKGLQYVRKSVESFQTAKYYSSDYSFVKGTEFKKDEYNEMLSKHVYVYNGEADFIKGENIKEIIEYDDFGVVTNGDKFSIGLKPFLSSSYYNIPDIVEKAWSFITSLVPESTVGPTVISDSLLDVTTPVLMIVPQIKVLYTGATYYKGYGNKPIVKQAIKDKFISYFKDWANNVFPKYYQTFSLKPLNGKSLSDMKAELSRNTKNDEAIQILKKYIDWIDFDRLYARARAHENDGTLFANPRTGPEMNELVTDLCSATIVALPTKYNSTTYENGPKNTIMKVSQFKTYMEGVIEGLREQLYVETTNTDDTSSAGDTSGGTSIATTTIDLTNNTDDIKVGVYNYIKMLYDKWVASGDILERYSMEKMFYSNDHTFHFIDSFYNKIGKTMFLNIGTIVDIIYSCQSQNGYSLLSMLSGIYASNKFQFLCIQNFLDLSKKSNIETMFKPIPYIEMERPDNHPDFVVLYPYEASSKLDVDGADYPDDTFYLNESTTWPAMINSKSDTDPAIPAFGVTYGQMYQNYFKNIQVDMNTPMVTEQSIKAKFMVSGAQQPSQNNGTRITTVGQDLYTIYSNNSYTCTVTMMGCAWVQPMMYFVLQNVPMFRGSYLICKVSHQITPGDMITTFVGVRMSKHATRAVKEFIYGSITTYNGGLTDAESFAARNANVGNDCEWAFYDPNGSGVIDGSVVVGESPATAQKERLTINQNSSAKCKNPSGMQYRKGKYYEYQTMTDGYKATASLLLKYLTGEMQKCPKNPTVIEICAVWIHGHKFSEMNPSLQAATTTEGNKRAKTAGLAPNVKLPITKDILLRLTMSFGIHEVSYLNKTEATNGVDRAWSEYTSNGGKADVIQPSANASSGNTKTTMYNNFAQAVQSSLKASDAYANASLTMTDRGGGWILLSASGTNANNALFDCLIQTYSNWWSSAYFGCNSNKISGEPYGVHVYMTSGSSTTHNISTYDKSTNKAVQLTRKEDINEGFKMSMIKYFRKNGITDVTKAKAILKSIGRMPDETIKEVFELGKDNGTIQNCNSLMGSPSVGIEGGYVKNTLPSAFTKGEVGKYNLVCHRYSNFNGAYQDVIYEYDTGNVLCYALENPTYVKANKLFPGKIFQIVFGCSAGFARDHHPGLSWYSTNEVAGRYGCGKTFGAENTVLCMAGTDGCAFHAGRHGRYLPRDKKPWTLGCVLIGSKPKPTTGDRDSGEFFKCYDGDYKSKKFIISTCPEIVWMRRFYMYVINAMKRNLKPQIEFVNNFSGEPKVYGPTGITTTTSSSTGGNTGNLVSLKSELTRNGLKENEDFEMVIPYATNHNFTKNVIPGYSSNKKDTYACPTMAAAVVKAIKYMKKQYPGKYKLAIFDCFRPKEACYSMADYARKHNPSWLGKYVADAKRGGTPKSNHYKGAAIDVSLKYRNGGYLKMSEGQGTGPGGFDEFSNNAHYNQSNANHTLLRNIMKNGGGLSPYQNEWWHFQSTGGVSGGETRYDK